MSDNLIKARTFVNTIYSEDGIVDTIGIVGKGIVGNALFEGMKHAFNVLSYDKDTKWDGCGIRDNKLREQSSRTDSHSNRYMDQCFADEKWDSDEPIRTLLRFTDGPIFVCVPTPMNNNGSCNTSIVEEVVGAIAESAEFWGKKEPTCGYKRVVCIKSTVVPNTTERLGNKYQNIHVCFNPEFLTERNAVKDFKNQDRIILGGPREGTNILKQIYETAYPDVPVTKTSSTIAEMVKYMTNCFLAVKVSFANEMKQVCDLIGIDYDKVVEYATKDGRLGESHWAVPGPDGILGFGKACLPKDLNCILAMAKGKIEPHVLKGAWKTNIEVRPEKDSEGLTGRDVPPDK